MHQQCIVLPQKKLQQKKVEPDTFKATHHKLKWNIETKLTELLKAYDSQFAQDETSIGTTALTEMTIDTGTSEPYITKAIPNSNVTLQMGQGWNK